MNLLLLLSAMLSALTGVGGTARVREPAVAARVIASVAETTQVAATARPQPTLPRLAALPAAPLASFALLPAEPSYAARRRE